jgi:hypothetical protein
MLQSNMNPRSEVGRLAVVLFTLAVITFVAARVAIAEPQRPDLPAHRLFISMAPGEARPATPSKAQDCEPEPMGFIEQVQCFLDRLLREVQKPVQRPEFFHVA